MSGTEASTLVMITLLGVTLVHGLRVVRNGGNKVWLYAAVVLAVGVVGPYFSDTGITQFPREQQEVATDALNQAKRTLEPSLRRILFAPSLQVVAVTPLPPGTLDHLGTAPCRYAVTVRAAGSFWLPYRTVQVRCGVVLVAS